MPTRIYTLKADGLHAVGYTAKSLAEAATYEPDEGVYTVANTFDTDKTLKLEAHLDRLEDSAHRANIPLSLNRDALKSALRQMILEAGFGSVRFRVTVPKVTPDQFILSIEPFTPPSQAIKAGGVRCITVKDHARQNAAAKTTGWMHARKALTEAMPEDIYDTFLLDDGGYLLEGLGSNFYAILNDELRTADSGVLPGIAQQIVFEIAPNIVPINKQAIHLDDLSSLQEAFLTSSSRGIIPIIEIDGVTIRSGQRGTYTQQLQDLYDRWVQEHLVTL